MTDNTQDNESLLYSREVKTTLEIPYETIAETARKWREIQDGDGLERGHGHGNDASDKERQS